MDAEIISYWPIILQTLIIVVAVAASYSRIKERIVVLETRADYAKETIDGLVVKVDGISRYVAKVKPE